MSLINDQFLKKYHQILYRFFNFEKLVKPINVDFQAPWWFTLLKRKWLLGLAIISELLQAGFEAVSPLILGYAILNRNWWVLIFFELGYIILELLNRAVLRVFNLAVTDIVAGTRISAYSYFLTVDPIYHATKSSGKILAKVDRSTQNLGQTIFMFTGSLLPVISGFVFVVITLAVFDLVLGLVGIISLILITIVNGTLSYANAKTFQKEIIKAGDQAMATATENLIQNSLIRASFATNEQSIKTYQDIVQEGVVRTTSALVNGVTTTITRILYITGVVILSVLVFDLIQQSQIEPIIGVTLIVTYINGSSQTLRLGDTIRSFTEYIKSINDLFDYIRDFGEQTYPVLKNDLILK